MNPLTARIWTPVLLLSLILTSRAPAQQTEPQPVFSPNTSVLFLHHSIGECVWNGGFSAWFEDYSSAHRTRYAIEERASPKDPPHGWENYPYNYWNVWVRHNGSRAYREEPTLEMLTKQHGVIVFKHCFSVSNIEPDVGRADVSSPAKCIENYKLM